MDKLKIGFAITGSFCTHERALNAMRDLKEKGHDLLPIFSFNVANTDTRFGNAKEFRKKVEEITGKEVVDTIVKAEVITVMSYNAYNLDTKFGKAKDFIDKIEKITR